MLSSSQNNYPKIKGAVGANHNAEEQSDAVRNDLGGEEGARGSDCEQVVEETVSRKRKRKEVGSSSYNRSNEKVSKWVSSWYPQMNREEVEAACPFCRNNCNCKACMRQDERMQSQLHSQLTPNKVKQHVVYIHICKTAIFDYYRTCSACAYDVCLVCCRVILDSYGTDL
ncbi:hypothetical protein LINPERHAP2_LOCUS5590 [Linum perenne]